MPMPAWPSGSARSMPACSREAHHGEVAGAAAEIRDQYGGIAVQPAGEGERRAHRLVDIARVAGAEPFERRLIALHRQRLIGIAAGKAHGAADHDVGRLEAERVSAMARQRAEERRENILELEALPEHLGGVEAGAGGKGLERLDEAVDVASFEKLLDRPRATFGLGSAARPVLPEAQRRDVDAVAPCRRDRSEWPRPGRSSAASATTVLLVPKSMPIETAGEALDMNHSDGRLERAGADH